MFSSKIESGSRSLRSPSDSGSQSVEQKQDKKVSRQKFQSVIPQDAQHQDKMEKVRATIERYRLAVDQGDAIAQSKLESMNHG